MSDTPVNFHKKPELKVYALSCLGLTVLPFALFVAGIALGVTLADHGSAWPVGLFVWAALGLACGVPAFRAARSMPKGDDARVFGIIFAVLGSIVGAVAALFGYFMSAMGGAHGRPLRKNGRALSAPAAPSETWTGNVRPSLEGLDPALREALAAEWLDDARLEHASVAAFAQLSLDLLAAGAPPALVDRCHRAASDEIEHARGAFALAGAYAGKPLGPGLFPEASTAGSADSAQRTRARLAVEALVDGCVGEGAAAASLAEAASACVDPAVTSVLRAAARDEANHAELASDVLAWAVKEGGPDVAREARRALDALTLAPPPEERWPAALREALATHGRLPAAREMAIRAQVIEAIRATWRERLS